MSVPIMKNKVDHLKERSLHVSSLKNDCSLFSRLYNACQTRDGNLQDFSHHENQPCPPFLSQLGKLRLGTKADVIIIDCAVVVNFLKPVPAETFEYALKVFLPYIQIQLQPVRRDHQTAKELLTVHAGR